MAEPARAAAPRAGRHRAGKHRSAKTRRRPARLLLGAGLAAAPAAVAVFSGLTDGGATPRGAADARPVAPTSSGAPAVAAPSLNPAPDPRRSEVTRTLERQRTASKSAPSQRAAERQTRGASAQRVAAATPDWLRDCAPAPGDLPNGAVEAAYLCTLPDTDEQLTRTAAADWVKLSRAYDERFGEAPCITDSYRSLAAQSSLYAVKPGLAARPGTSNHGWGVALDLCGGAESYSTEEYAWLAENGHRWGWSNPDWARLSGSRPEPWHWEHAAS